MSKKLLVGLLGVLLVAGIMINGCGEAAKEAEEDQVALPEAGVTGIEAGANGIDYDAGETSATLYVMVVDQNDNPVTNLLSGNVDVAISYSGSSVITDNCTVVNVHNKAGTPAENISVAMALDTSGSMDDGTSSGTPEPISTLIVAAKNFVDLMGAGDEVAIIDFASRPVTGGISMTATTATNKSILKNYIDGLWAGGWTALYDAIAFGADEAYAGAKPRKVILAMTDGGENDSGPGTPWFDVGQDCGTNLSALIGYVQGKGIPVYTIGLNVSDIDDENANGISDEQELKDVASGTGGLYYSAPTKEDLSGLYSKFSNALNNYYNVTLSSPVAFETGKTYTMTFRVVNYGGLTTTSTYTFKVP